MLLLLLVLPPRKIAIADPPGVQTFVTLVPLPLTTMGPPALSPELGASFLKPPLVLTSEEGSYTSTVAKRFGTLVQSCVNIWSLRSLSLTRHCIY